MHTETLSNKSWVNLMLAGYTDPLAFTINASGSLIGFNPWYNVENNEQITTVVIPPTIAGTTCTNIKSGVFNTVEPLHNDRGIKIIVGPKTLTSIDDYAFAGCTLLTSLFLYGEPPTVGFNVFNNVNPNLVIYRLATSGTTEWTTEFEGIPVVEVDNFQSVLDADRPKYLRDTTDSRLHEIIITDHRLKSGLIK